MAGHAFWPVAVLYTSDGWGTAPVCYDRVVGMGTAPQGTVTFLFTDIEGSTRLLERLGTRYGEVLARERDLIREALAR